MREQYGTRQINRIFLRVEPLCLHAVFPCTTWKRFCIVKNVALLEEHLSRLLCTSFTPCIAEEDSERKSKKHTHLKDELEIVCYYTTLFASWRCCLLMEAAFIFFRLLTKTTETGDVLRSNERPSSPCVVFGLFVTNNTTTCTRFDVLFYCSINRHKLSFLSWLMMIWLHLGGNGQAIAIFSSCDVTLIVYSYVFIKEFILFSHYRRLKKSF